VLRTRVHDARLYAYTRQGLALAVYNRSVLFRQEVFEGVRSVQNAPGTTRSLALLPDGTRTSKLFIIPF
jgi:hypothetical protein